MKRIKKEKRNIYFYFITMIVVFIAVNILCQILPNLIAMNINYSKYGSELLFEILFAFIILIVMLLFKNSYVFTEKKMKFKDSVLLGLPMLILIGINLYGSISSLESFNSSNFFNLLLLCIFIGISEEFLCRGWLQNEFIERFGDTKKHIILSIVFSSLIFGLMHISNLLTGQSLFQTITQILQATSIGILFGSIYYRSKNIWSVIFLHGLYDFSIMLSDINLVKDCTCGTPSTSIALYSTFASILIILYYIFNALLILRTTDLKEKKKEIKDNKFVVIGLITTFILMMLPLGIFVTGYDEYQTCYNYEIKTVKNYDFIKHIPNYKSYDISYEKNYEEYNESELFNYTFEDKTDYILVTNKNTKDSIKLEFNNLSGFFILKNVNKYTIIAYTNDGYNSEIYYSSFITENNMSNDRGYLNEIKDSFNKYDLPSISAGGYLTFKNDDYKYPYFIGSTPNHFMLDMNDKLYMIKGED